MCLSQPLSGFTPPTRHPPPSPLHPPIGPTQNHTHTTLQQNMALRDMASPSLVPAIYIDPMSVHVRSGNKTRGHRPGGGSGYRGQWVWLPHMPAAVRLLSTEHVQWLLMPAADWCVAERRGGKGEVVDIHTQQHCHT